MPARSLHATGTGHGGSTGSTARTCPGRARRSCHSAGTVPRSCSSSFVVLLVCGSSFGRRLLHGRPANPPGRLLVAAVPVFVAVALHHAHAAAGSLLGFLGRRGRGCGGGGVCIAALAGERPGRRLDAVLLEPGACLTLGAALLAVARLDLRRDRWQRRELGVAFG